MVKGGGILLSDSLGSVLPDLGGSWRGTRMKVSLKAINMEEMT